MSAMCVPHVRELILWHLSCTAHLIRAYTSSTQRVHNNNKCTSYSLFVGMSTACLNILGNLGPLTLAHIAGTCNPQLEGGLTIPFLLLERLCGCAVEQSCGVTVALQYIYIT